MSNAGWLDVWHLVSAVVGRQSPFAQIMSVTGAALLVVMALEGFRVSLLAIWRGLKTAPAPAAPRESPLELAAAASPPFSKSFSVKPLSRIAAGTGRKRKALTVSVRQFRSPRPTIRRHAALADDAFP